MRTHRWKWIAVPLTLGAVACLSAPVLAQHGQGEPAEAHEAPETYAQAVAEIDERLENIDNLIKTGKLENVHAEAQVIVDVANTLAALALKPGSGVPREAVREINVTAKELAGKFDAIDRAGDSGDAAGTRTVWGEMVELQRILKQHAPAVTEAYACPMRCEGTKTYGEPGQCPMCKMDLKMVTAAQYSVDVKPVAGRIEAGKPVTLALTIKDPTGATVTNLKTVHERDLHMLMVSKDLSWYAHEHPVGRRDGMFTLAFTFPAPGQYVLFHDFTPESVGQQVVPVDLTVPGTPPTPVPLRIDASRPKTVDAYTVALDAGTEIATGGETHFSYTITRGGTPVTDLEPYLGAMGHLVIISQDLMSFVHSHPHEEGDEHGEGEHEAGEEHAAGEAGSKVEFEAWFDKPGVYKSWAQFQHGGKVITVPFTFEVKQGSGEAKPHEHHDEGEGGHQDGH